LEGGEVVIQNNASLW
jgi:hypothetical protein